MINISPFLCFRILARAASVKGKLGGEREREREATKSAFQNGDQAVIWFAPAAAAPAAPRVVACSPFFLQKNCLGCAKISQKNVPARRYSRNVPEGDSLLKVCNS